MRKIHVGDICWRGASAKDSGSLCRVVCLGYFEPDDFGMNQYGVRPLVSVPKSVFQIE